MKKIIALVVVAMLIVTVVPQAAFAASGTDIWDGNADTRWYTASDTEFTISTAEELAGLAEIVNAGTDTFEGDTITLENNLDLDSLEWTPIGISGKPFLGVFDGGSNIISNMNVGDKSSFYVGLFGVAVDYSSHKGGTLKNLSVLNVDVECFQYGGGLVGTFRYGEIINCHTSGNINGYAYLGGLAGSTDNPPTTIENSSSSANVKGEESGSRVGGLLGDANSNMVIKNSYATGNVEGGTEVGGLVGSANYFTIIENSYATGNVKGNRYAGGLVGGGSSVTIVSSYATGNVEGEDYVGGLVSDGNNAAKITNSYATGIVVSKNKNYTGGLVGALVPLSNIINSYGNNANDEGVYGGSNGTQYVPGTEGVTLGEMQTEKFKNTLNGDSTALQPFAIDPNFNNGYPYLVTIPQIMSGDGQTIKQGDVLTIKATMPYGDGMALTTKVGGVEVPEGKVTYSSGSTIATLSGEYTANLKVGTYSIEIASHDYGTVNGTFTVIADDPVPETGDTVNIHEIIAISMLSILGAYVVAMRKVKVK